MKVFLIVIKMKRNAKRNAQNLMKKVKMVFLYQMAIYPQMRYMLGVFCCNQFAFVMTMFCISMILR